MHIFLFLSHIVIEGMMQEAYIHDCNMFIRVTQWGYVNIASVGLTDFKFWRNFNKNRVISEADVDGLKVLLNTFVTCFSPVFYMPYSWIISVLSFQYLRNKD